MSIWKYLYSLEHRRNKLLRKMPDSPLREYYQTAFPDQKSDWRDVDYLALDLETTGLDKKKDEILSIGYSTISGQSLLLGTSVHILTKPTRNIPESSAVVHGILDDEASRALTLEEVLPTLLQALAGKVMLAHFANIEYEFIGNACQLIYGYPFICPVTDTLALEAKKFKTENRVIGSGDLRLANARERYGLPRYPAHNALTDAIAAGELFLAQIAHRNYPEQPILKDLMVLS